MADKVPEKQSKLLFAALLAGFFANLLQVSLFRFFMGNFYGTEIHLGLFLSIWLAGTATGGYFGGKLKTSPAGLLSAIFFLPFVCMATLIYGIHHLPTASGSYLPYGPVIKLMLATVFPTATVSGMLIPSMVRASNQSLGLFYSLESTGAFISGLVFSIIIGGTADPVLCLTILPLPAIAAVLMLTDHKKLAGFGVLAIAPLAFLYGHQISEKIENLLWNRLNKVQKLEKTIETPYQKLQLSSYHELKSIFSNGMFADSWPMAESAENRVHTFMSALKAHDEILIIGAPTTDMINEFLKYSVRLTIVEIDEIMVDLLDYQTELKQKLNIEFVDPRLYLNNSQRNFDGIFINQISPVTLAGNRLFTVEAFRAASLRLKPGGVFAIQVTGSENYLGSVTEKLILSLWTGFKSVFPYSKALPGSNLTFLGSLQPDIIPSSAREFASRLSGRNILTATFQPMSFYNMLMPFRVDELEKWLNRPYEGSLNHDSHPDSFLKQLELWNIYSGSGQQNLSSVIAWVSSINPWFFLLFLTVLFILAPLVLPVKSGTGLLISSGVGISGATGLLSEIILILAYQNRFGGAYQMTAFFFAVYMLGLASGSITTGYIKDQLTASRRIIQVKSLQIVFTAFCVFFIQASDYHSALTISLMIFLIAFIDGIEFPVADSILRNMGQASPVSAGLLLFADSSGALFSGLLSGLVLLPAIGMRGCFYLLLICLAANLLSLLFFKRRLESL